MTDDKTTFRGYRDEFGFAGAMPQWLGVSKVPDEDFYSGPEIDEPLPGFTLIDQWGKTRDLHVDRAGSKAAVVFNRSAVW